MLLFVICFVGACAGSTTSGIKIVHYVILFKYLYGTVRRIMLQPMAVSTVRLNGRAIESSAVELAICYFVVNIFMVLGGGIVMTFIDDLDYLSAMSSVISALMNIGPGFGEVGPTHTFAPMSDFSKWFLAWNMLVGRLEMFSALVIFYPAFWKK